MSARLALSLVTVALLSVGCASTADPPPETGTTVQIAADVIDDPSAAWSASNASVTTTSRPVPWSPPLPSTNPAAADWFAPVTADRKRPPLPQAAYTDSELGCMAQWLNDPENAAATGTIVAANGSDLGYLQAQRTVMFACAPRGQVLTQIVLSIMTRGGVHLPNNDVTRCASFALGTLTDYQVIHLEDGHGDQWTRTWRETCPDIFAAKVLPAP